MAAPSFTLVRLIAHWALAMLLVALSGCAPAPSRTVPPLDDVVATSPPPWRVAATAGASDPSRQPAAVSSTSLPEVTSTTGFLVLGDESGIPGRLSAGGPWTLTPSAPGVSAPGLTYLLRPGLWVFLPLVEDHEHGVVWVFRQSDRAIVEAYLRAWITYFDHATANPMSLDPAGWTPTIADGGATFQQVLAQAASVGGHLEAGDGIVLRPEVIDDHRSASTARVLDCVLDGSFLVDRAGALVGGSSRGVARSGWAMDLVLTDAGWKGERVGGAVEAC